MNTVYEFLIKHVDPRKIETIHLQEGYIEYRIWNISSIAYNNRITNFGKRCTAKYLEYNGEECFDEKWLIKDEDKEFFTEDEEFYEKMTGICNIHRFIGCTHEEMMERLKEK